MRTIDDILKDYVGRKMEEAARIARREAVYLEGHLIRALNEDRSLEEAYREWLFD